MRHTILFFAGVAVRLVGVVAEHYASWLLRRIGDGAEIGIDILSDLKAFLRALLDWAAEQLRGRRSLDYEDGWHRGFDY